MTKFLNISIDPTLGGVNTNDVTVSSQKAVKTYVDETSKKKLDIEQGVDNSGKILVVGNDGNIELSNSSPGTLPEQEGNDGKFLTTDGKNASWKDINTTRVIIREW